MFFLKLLAYIKNYVYICSIIIKTINIMKDLDKKEVYSLEAIKKDEAKFKQFKDWLRKNDKYWNNTALSCLENESFLGYFKSRDEWMFEDREENSICALTLFEEEFVPNTVIEVSHNGNIPAKTVLTKQQIADKFGLDINLIEIENE